MVVRLFAFTLCLSCIGVGLYLSLICVDGILLGYTVADWPTAPARIVSCDLETFMDEGSTTYRIDVSYRYTVEGVAYTAKGIHPAVNNGGGELRELYARLEGAKSVLVRYDPDDPSEAYLFGGGFSKPLNEVFGALTLLVFGTLFFLMVYCAQTGGSAYAERLAIVR